MSITLVREQLSHSRRVEFMRSNMKLQVQLIPGAIADLFAQVSCSGKITLADRYGLMAAILEDSITQEERESIDRLLRAFRKGRMQMVNEISAQPYCSCSESPLAIANFTLKN